MIDTLFDMPEAKEPPLRLRADRPVYNYMRIQKGQNLKVNLRDRSTGRIVATIYGGERMAAQIVAAVNGKQETMMGRGDCAKMREALKATLDLFWDIHNANRSPQSNQAYAVIRQIKAALAAPPRNCDVGTAGEQAERYMNFCHNYPRCTGCPCVGRIKYHQCGIAWAQLPCEEGGAK